jgi:hypothetical protein
MPRNQEIPQSWRFADEKEEPSTHVVNNQRFNSLYCRESIMCSKGYGAM